MAALMMFENNEDSNLSMPSTPASGMGLDNGTETDTCLELGLDTDSQVDSGTESVTTKAKRRRRDEIDIVNESKVQKFPAENLFEYQWPLDKSGEYYMLQEQVSEYLGVKSFKRKYPEMNRRPVEIKEREFLKEKLVVTEHQCDLGLTAVRSDEIHDLMAKEYPAKYQEYASVLHEREKERIANKHKDYSGQQNIEKSKYEYYRQKAIRGAAEYNLNFMRERREERKAYFDLQTQLVHYPKNTYPALVKEATKPSSHPVALIPGQFQEYYKKYTSDELKYLPIRSTVFLPPKHMRSTLAAPEEGNASDSEKSKNSDTDSSSDSETGSEDGHHGNSKTINRDEIKAVVCQMCKEEKTLAGSTDLVKCAECSKYGHPACLELTEEMTPIIQTYPWQCMECKTCVECTDPGDEEKMLFCDRCDRGYHTFCVGLRSLPTGRWECPSCRPSQASVKSRKGRR